MVKFAHLLILSVLVVWIAGSGCFGNDSSDVGDGGVTENVTGTGSADELDIELTTAEIQELNSDMVELKVLLDNASPEEEIEIEEL